LQFPQLLFKTGTCLAKEHNVSIHKADTNSHLRVKNGCCLEERTTWKQNYYSFTQ